MQDPDRHAHSSSVQILCTIIKNIAICFSVPHNRWMTGSECLIAQGFPTNDVLRVVNSGVFRPGARFCSFNGPLEGRNHNRVKEQAGNSMAIPVAGFLWVYIFGFLRFI
eukprot:1724171-Pyramimonas_sp.AAC.1